MGNIQVSAPPFLEQKTATTSNEIERKQNTLSSITHTKFSLTKTIGVVVPSMSETTTSYGWMTWCTVGSSDEAITGSAAATIGNSTGAGMVDVSGAASAGGGVGTLTGSNVSVVAAAAGIGAGASAGAITAAAGTGTVSTGAEVASAGVACASLAAEMSGVESVLVALGSGAAEAAALRLVAGVVFLGAGTGAGAALPWLLDRERVKTMVSVQQGCEKQSVGVK